MNCSQLVLRKEVNLMKRNQIKILIALFMALTSFQLFAKRFTNQYCEFELPSGWNCALEGAEWVCQSENAARKKEAIIILAAKIRGAQDSLQDYQAYLKKKKTFMLPGNKTQISEPKYADIKSVNDHQWIDSLHLASEVPGFYTRYLATVKEDLGVAVTFSVAKDLYNDYQGLFEKIIGTLRVFRQKQGGTGNLQIKRPKDIAGQDIQFIPDGEKSDINVNQQTGKHSGGIFGSDDSMLYLILAAVGIFIFIRMKKKKK